MFSLLVLENIKTIAASIFLNRLRLPRIVQHKSSDAKPERTSRVSKEENRANEEVFFPPLRNKGIKDKVALVTGGANGIGLRCVRELLTSGAKGVMIADMNEEKGLRKVIELSKDHGRDRVAFIQINPASYLYLKNAFSSTINYYKGLDVVINNIKFGENNWEDQIDEQIKRIVLSTQLSIEFMGSNNGGKGGILLNIASNLDEHSESRPLHLAVQDFIVRFDQSVASTHLASNIKVLTICKATLDCIGCDLATILTKGPSGCVWQPT